MGSHTLYVALGSNLGDRVEMLERALESFTPEITIRAKSSVYETPPWGYEDQPRFLNQVVEARTDLSPTDSLTKLKEIEEALGRVENFRFGPRAIDLDILFFDDLIFETGNLTIPHPHLTERAFVLVPLMDIAPDHIHPISGKSVSELALNVSTDGIVKFANPRERGNFMLDWQKETYVMGILNITPDSFSGDGTLAKDDPVASAVKQAREFVRAGARILDLGAESSRPGSEPITAEEELQRLMPVLEGILAEDMDALISVDTYKSEVAEKCLAAGAHWINDIWALERDADLAGVAADHQAGLILMHNRSKTGAVEKDKRLGASYDGAAYTDFLNDVRADLEGSVQIALNAGVSESNIILDPGIGFGKTVDQNLELINRLDAITILGYPVLLGPSRKSFIGHVLDLPVDERLPGTAAACTVGIMRGANIIRVHDVGFIAPLARMTDTILGKGNN